MLTPRLWSIRWLVLLLAVVCAAPLFGDATYDVSLPGVPLAAISESAPLWEATWSSVSGVTAPQSLTSDLEFTSSDGVLTLSALSTEPSTESASDILPPTRPANLKLCVLLVILACAVVAYFTSPAFRQYLIDLYSPLAPY